MSCFYYRIRGTPRKTYYLMEVTQNLLQARQGGLTLHFTADYLVDLNAPSSALNLSLNFTIKGPFGRSSRAFSINA